MKWGFTSCFGLEDADSDGGEASKLMWTCRGRRIEVLKSMMPNWPEKAVLEVVVEVASGEVAEAVLPPLLSSWSVTGIPIDAKGLL